MLYLDQPDISLKTTAAKSTIQNTRVLRRKPSPLQPLTLLTLNKCQQHCCCCAVISAAATTHANEKVNE